MKNIVYLLTTCFLLGSVHAAEMRSKLDGLWSNQRYNLQIRVEHTNNGIRVQRTDRSRWHVYEEIRLNQFRDREGNTYQLINDQTLEWESRNGGKRIRFVVNAPRRRAISARDLHGTWFDLWDNDCLVVRARRGVLRVRGIGFGTRTFHPTRSGFRDHKGNLLRLEGRRLLHINRRGRLIGRFGR